MKGANHNQKEVLEDLALVTQAYSELVARMQTDLTDLVKAGIAALNDGNIDARKIGESVTQALFPSIDTGDSVERVGGLHAYSGSLY